MYSDFVNARKFSAGDSIALTQLSALCPLKDGAVIYQARALLRIVTHDLVAYNDDCEQGKTLKEQKSMERRAPGSMIQDYSLIPNPNDGNMQLLQALSDTEPVQIRVYNAVGAMVYQNTLQFSAKQAGLSLGHLSPGIYHIRLVDAAGTASTLKFVKQ